MQTRHGKKQHETSSVKRTKPRPKKPFDKEKAKTLPIYKMIEEAKEQLGIESDAEAARRCGMERSYLYQIKYSQRKNYGARIARKIANGLKIPFDDLVKDLDVSPDIRVEYCIESGDVGFIKMPEADIKPIPRPTWLNDPTATAALVRGNGLAGRFEDGDILILSNVTHVTGGSRIGVQLHSGEFFLKKCWDNGDTLTLESLHGEKPRIVNKSDIVQIYTIRAIIPACAQP